ncbi:MAG: hypothetical protein IJI80_04420 [Methanobrevibacter sp.]|uniref:hypothetical protein n=1 Tax=Methanobrevibacter sp. TaxID=66852 RepID=UPI0025E415E9|nr:hypothetical protein [Methanobrevibacter sp.]MBQ6098998.1 hypothetical protein [Methanobrevibacter sp.]MBQ6138903.1 hypothetical protein [Methanobrevibacter sp.]
METVKMERFKIVPTHRREGLSLIDIEGTYNQTFPEWKTIVTVSTGNKYLDQKIMDSIFEDINTNPEYLKLLNTPDKKEGD